MYGCYLTRISLDVPVCDTLDSALQDCLAEARVARDMSVECHLATLHSCKQGFLRANEVFNSLFDLFVCDMVTV